MTPKSSPIWLFCRGVRNTDLITFDLLSSTRSAVVPSGDSATQQTLNLASMGIVSALLLQKRQKFSINALYSFCMNNQNINIKSTIIYAYFQLFHENLFEIFKDKSFKVHKFCSGFRFTLYFQIQPRHKKLYEHSPKWS